MTNQTDNRPAPRPCSQCGELLQPFLQGTSINSDYTTRYHWGFGHYCPKQAARYDSRIKEIKNSFTMSGEQKHNAVQMAGYMNAWGS